MIGEDEKIRKFLLKLTYREQELLVALNGGKSVKQAAKDLGGNEHTLATNLVNLNKAYMEWSGHELVNNLAGRKGYALTEHGRLVVAALVENNERLTDALVSIVAAPREIEVTVTHDCIGHFKELQEELRKHPPAEFSIRPKVLRAAEIYESLGQLDKIQDVGPCAFFSRLAPLGTENTTFAKGKLIDLDARRFEQMLVIKAQDFQLLAPVEEFKFTSPVTLESVLEDHWELIVPRGGAVRDFLRKRLPRWDRIGSRLIATDLNACLDILKHNIRPRTEKVSNGIMIVHGLDPERVPKGYTIYDLQHPPEHKPYQALSGLVRNGQMFGRSGKSGQMPGKLNESQEKQWETLWSTAVKLWREDAD